MPKMGIACFTDGSWPTDFVAPKADYPNKDNFLEACKGEFEYYDEHQDKLKIENIKEGYCRYYPVAPDGFGLTGGCYSFCSPRRGAFEVWYIPLNE